MPTYYVDPSGLVPPTSCDGEYTPLSLPNDPHVIGECVITCLCPDGETIGPTTAECVKGPLSGKVQCELYTGFLEVQDLCDDDEGGDDPCPDIPPVIPGNIDDNENKGEEERPLNELKPQPPKQEWFEPAPGGGLPAHDPPPNDPWWMIWPFYLLPTPGGPPGRPAPVPVRPSPGGFFPLLIPLPFLEPLPEDSRHPSYT